MSELRSNEEEWAKLAEAATPGPWELGWEDGNGWVAFVDNEGERGAAERHVVTSRHAEGDNANADAEFVAAAREAVPALLAEVTRLRIENAELRARIDGVLSLCDAQDEADLRPDPPDFEPHSIAWTTVVRAALAEPLGSTPDPPAEGRSE